MTLVNCYIGAPIERVEDLRFLRVPGEYIADLVPEEMHRGTAGRRRPTHLRSARDAPLRGGQHQPGNEVHRNLRRCRLAFREADYTSRGRFSVQRHTALPMEPRGLLVEWDSAAGRLTVMGAAKVPFFNRRSLAGLMGLPESAVDLIENDVGGRFGARGELSPEDFLSRLLMPAWNWGATARSRSMSDRPRSARDWRRSCADRRRRAGADDRQGTRAARLDDISRRRLRLVPLPAA